MTSLLKIFKRLRNVIYGMATSEDTCDCIALVILYISACVCIGYGGFLLASYGYAVMLVKVVCGASLILALIRFFKRFSENNNLD